jgi:hypothetical protein
MLRRACRSDVDALCKSEDALASETGEVYRCLVHNYDDLDPNCKKELGRAVHMAFFIWSPNSIMTRECDADVQRICLQERPNMDRIPGQVGTCLADVVSCCCTYGSLLLVLLLHACCCCWDMDPTCTASMAKWARAWQTW